MNKIKILLIIFILLITYNSTILSANIKYVDVDFLNVRIGPGIKYKSIGKLYENSVVSIISTSNNWSKIIFNGKPGYISSKYLKNVPKQTNYILNVPFINQYPELPMGCEATSLAQLLNYKGISVSKFKIVKDLPISPTKDPNLGFVGDPSKVIDGLFQTIYPLALEKTAKKYRPNSENITGKDINFIENELKKGNPSIIWATFKFKKPNMVFWYENTNDEIYVNENLHILTVTGFDENYFYITDPAYGKYKVKKSKFEKVYNKTRKMALVIR